MLVHKHRFAIHLCENSKKWSKFKTECCFGLGAAAYLQDVFKNDQVSLFLQIFELFGEIRCCPQTKLPENLREALAFATDVMHYFKYTEETMLYNFREQCETYAQLKDEKIPLQLKRILQSQNFHLQNLFQ